ncbi:hypothetical protein P43SY_003883 [Pythium insidiosum]|uniref:Autophagy-related protein 9 n=1 Tax=Pythium insidiosum TaxID=114742 RepID=A0AAD5M0I3_PYTIN|nr:hypothetical protein P43SY_003883 [Pythium insidiosum]
MDESLLGPPSARMPVADEDEELWNALSDGTHGHVAASPHAVGGYGPPPAGAATGAAAVSVSGAPSRFPAPLMRPGSHRVPPPRGYSRGHGSAFVHDEPAAETEAFLGHGGRTAQTAATPLPALRSNVHLPAISTLFQNIMESARSKLMGAGEPPSGAASQGGATAPTPVRSPGVPDELGRVANLDAFLINLYNYFYHKGFWCIAVVEVVSLFTGVFSLSLSSFLLGCVQWDELMACSKHEIYGCKRDLSQFVMCRPKEPGVWNLVVGFYFFMFLIYWLFRALQLLGTLRDAREMATFYIQRLNIDDRQIQTITWDEVVTRLLGLVGNAQVPRQLKQISSYRLQIDPTLLATPHDVARRIMRRENYLIAFMNHAIFQESKLLPSCLQMASTARVMFSRNIEANLNICLISQMFDGEQKLSMAALNDVQLLQKRFVVAGVLNLVLTPFILLFRVFHFLSQSAQEWNANRALYLGSRRWSSYALWKFREYNELPHAFEARLARSYPLAEKYLAMFPAGLTAVVASGVSFCASSLMAVLIAVSLLEESILLEMTLWNRQLLWYLTIATGVFAISRSFSTQSSPFLVNGDCEEAMRQLSAETHYFPKEWHGQSHSYDVRDALLSLYPFKAILFAEEVLSVLMAPYILCVSLPNCTRELVLFIRSHTLTIPNVGAVCRFAEFDFKRYTNDPKMESSFINFKQNHPTWVGAEEGEALVQRLHTLKEEEMEKSMRLGDSVVYGSQGLR